MKPKFFPTPGDFRQWLTENHESEQELWVGYYKKATGKPSLTWPESVEQALCYGWIDGLRKSIDEEAYKIRFTPRRPNSIWSAINLKMVERLKKEGLMQPAGLAAYKRRSEKRSEVYSFEQGNVKLAPEYEQQLKANPDAWEFFQSLPPSVKKPSVWWVMSAKQESTRQRRLGILIECSATGQRIPQLRRPGK